MKRLITILIFLIILISTVKSQVSQVNPGKVIGEIFTDYHYIVGDTTKTSGFGLNRAFFGYNYVPPQGNFSATLIINVGNPEELAAGSASKRYAHFREASVAYKKDKLDIYLGMVSTRIFDYQQAFWGKRYLGPEFQSMYGFGSVADLGIVADYRVNNILKFDVSILNGEGYNYVQSDNSLKVAGGILITAPNHISVRLYDDVMKKSGVWQSTMVAFAGFKNDVVTFGSEFTYKSNIDLLEGTDVWGLSATGSVFVLKKTDIFSRFDYITDVSNAMVKNDYNKYSTLFVGGIEHLFSQNLKIAVNYRRTNPTIEGRQSFDAFFVNAGFKF